MNDYKCFGAKLRTYSVKEYDDLEVFMEQRNQEIYELTQFLCAVIRSMDLQLSKELFDRIMEHADEEQPSLAYWWNNHQKYDRTMKTKENEKLQNDEYKEQQLKKALSKLNEYEKEMLKKHFTKQS